jgi:hypothetical protein
LTRCARRQDRRTTIAIYHILVRGHLPDRYVARFAPLTLTREPSGETLLAGELVDQGALFGILLKIRDLGLPLLTVSPDPGWDVSQAGQGE